MDPLTLQSDPLKPFAEKAVWAGVKLIAIEFATPENGRLPIALKDAREKAMGELVVNSLPIAAVAAVKTLQWLLTPPAHPRQFAPVGPPIQGPLRYRGPVPVF